MMTDFHSHVLPAMDDGSKDTAMSCEMLAESYRQGVTHVAATPHFYPIKEDPARFLRRRNASLSALLEKLPAKAADNTLPYLTVGAEVAFFAGMSRVAELQDFCYSGTNLMLVEMPFEKWNDKTLAELFDLRGCLGVVPLLAHIERYLAFQKRGIVKELLSNGMMIQTNASFFLRRTTRREAIRLLANGNLHVLGSDMHNVTSRPQKLGQVPPAITKGLSSAFCRDFLKPQTKLTGKIRWYNLETLKTKTK